MAGWSGRWPIAGRVMSTLLVLHDLPNGAMKHLEEFLDRLQNEGIGLTQEFPADSVPIVDGKVVLPLDPYVTS